MSKLGSSYFDGIIEALGSTLTRLPLFQDQGGATFEVIHAKWPSYPTGNGLICAISTLAEFPHGTKFFPIDFIDQCTLLVAEQIPKKNEYNSSAYHLCLYDDDIREMIRMGFVFGPNLIPNDPTEPEGTRPFVEYPPTRYIRLSEKGRHAADVFELTCDLGPGILEAVRDDLIDARYTDAVRRASILLEGRLRTASGTELYGQNLVDECFGDTGCLLPYAKCTLVYALEIRAMYRRFFKYIRNEVAHSEPFFNLTEACRLLRRCSVLMDVTDRLAHEKKARELNTGTQ